MDINIAPQTASAPPLSYDVLEGDGPLVVLLPGAGDVRSENRFLASSLEEAGYCVVRADLPGHGTSPIPERVGVAATAEALVALVASFNAGPAVLVGVSFAPAAMVWAARARPDLFSAMVAISPHFDEDRSFKGKLANLSVRLMLRGPLAAPLWDRLYRGWYKSVIPPDLVGERAAIRVMMETPARRRVVRETLVASRDGVAERMEAWALPTLVVFGEDDDHFSSPAAEARRVAEQLAAEPLMVEGAGHYPHVE